MDLTCEERLSDSPFVENVWRSYGETSVPFISIADARFNMVLTRYRGRTTVTLRGPEIRATPAYRPEGAEYIGIQFKPGTYMPHLPIKTIMDRQDLNLPAAGDHTFWLNGAAWQLPDFENADTFVDWLARDGLLVHEPAVAAAMQGQFNDLSPRSVQRRFLRATGLTQNTLRQIERARYAVVLLKQGVSILDTVELAGYFDQPHLTRSLRNFVGLTPAQITNKDRPERLSLLYKTDAYLLNYDTNDQVLTEGVA